MPSFEVPKSMRIVQHTQSTQQLEIRTVAAPKLGPKHYLIKVLAVGLTSGELWWRRPEDKDVSIPGVEYAGVIVRGPKNGPLEPGAKVYMRVRFPEQGAAAEYTTAIAPELSIRPSNITAVQAASVPVSALTAWQGLHEHASFDLRSFKLDKAAGETSMRILINGGSTTVGIWYMRLLYTMQFPRPITITATCSNANMHRVRDFGADNIIDYTKTDNFSAHGPYHIIFDCVGRETLDKCWRALAPNGSLFTIVPTLETTNYVSGPLTVPDEVKDRGIRGMFFLMRPNAEQLGKITKLIEEGRVEKPVVDSVHDFEAYEAAFNRVRSGRAVGKVILKVCEED